MSAEPASTWSLRRHSATTTPGANDAIKRVVLPKQPEEPS